MPLDARTLALGLVWYLVFLFSTTLHEAAHAWAALRLGDPTAYEGGQVTLNPWPHIRRELFGMVIVPLLTYFLAGWVMGWASAPYDPLWARRYPRRAAWMSLAGPASNLTLVLAAALGIRAGIAAGVFRAPAVADFSHAVESVVPGAFEGLAVALSVLFTLNLLLFAFNLLPIPPLDGSGALPLVLPASLAARWQDLLREPLFALLGLLVAWRLFSEVFGPLHALALNLLHPGAGYA